MGRLKSSIFLQIEKDLKELRAQIKKIEEMGKQLKEYLESYSDTSLLRKESKDEKFYKKFIENPLEVIKRVEERKGFQNRENPPPIIIVILSKLNPILPRYPNLLSLVS